MNQQERDELELKEWATRHAIESGLHHRDIVTAYQDAKSMGFVEQQAITNHFKEELGRRTAELDRKKKEVGSRTCLECGNKSMNTDGAQLLDRIEALEKELLKIYKTSPWTYKQSMPLAAELEERELTRVSLKNKGSFQSENAASSEKEAT